MNGEDSGVRFIEVLADGLIDCGLRDKISDPNVARRFIDLLQETGFPRLACRAVYWWAIVPAAGGVDAFLERRRDRASGWGARIGRHVLERVGGEKLLEYLQIAAGRTVAAETPSGMRAPEADDLESLRDWLSETFEDQAAAINAGIQALLEAERPNPPITLSDAVAPGSTQERRELLARTSPFDLIGREEQLKQLRAFLEEPGQFEWWVMTGAGGSGKSRLAYEFARYHCDDWDSGFLSSGVDFDWTRWQPLAPTLIFVDYAADKPEEVRRLLRACLGLAARDTLLEYEVRVVLVERTFPSDLQRTKTDPLWRRIFGGEGTVEDLAACYFRPQPMNLDVLLPDEAEQLIRIVHGREDSRPLPSALDEELKSDSTQLRRPLFLLLIGQTLRDEVAWKRANLECR